MESESQTVIISGGMGDVGKAIATKLSADGFKIYLLYNRTSKTEVDMFIASLSGNGHTSYKVDVTNEKEVFDVVKKINKIDICIHCAVSPIIRKSALNITRAEFRQQFEVTAFGGLTLFQAVAAHMKINRSGKIIGLTSEVLKKDSIASGMTGYLCAKEALQGILRDLSKELSNFNISVNAISPSFIPSSLNNDLPEAIISFITERSQTNSLDEVAKLASYLCLSKVFVTGISYKVGSEEKTPL
ncbi:SDR family oxidoreductase [Patescibacteria group bacterium]|nr:SDR family oxidoreductase [Patescibacteria group bacterium]